MSKHLSANSHSAITLLFFAICVGTGLVSLGFWSFRPPAMLSVPAVANLKVEQREQVSRDSGRALQGAAARRYLQQPGEGQSLMQAITAARFGLKRQERGPFGEPGSGYLGVSHEQNLNAWFAADGVTVRPTLEPQGRARAWHMEMRLKAYGYGNDLVAAPPIISQHVKDNRIEYQRGGDFRSQISNLEIQDDSLFQSAIGNRRSTITEWYENRAEGIEQGFTIGARMERNSNASDDPLRLLVSLNGDLTALVKEGGKAIELRDRQGQVALSYSKLTALDAGGTRLPAHMEASVGGSEIALVIDDRGASYPIVIDPIVANLEKILDASPAPPAVGPESGAQFGDAVAIDRDFAVVGAWLDDASSGVVYVFSRTGTVWGLRDYSFGSNQAGAKCGYSVAISNDKVVYGCPGTNANAGIAVLWDFTKPKAAVISPCCGFPHAGDFFGASVAIINNKVEVGAPATPLDGKINVGEVYHFVFDSALNVSYVSGSGPSDAPQNGRFGDALAIDETTLLIGMPGTNQVVVDSPRQTLQANDSASGDLFGQNISLSGNTAVIGAPANDEKGTDAGAAYVFVRDGNGQWTQQQKLTAGDGKAADLFSYYAAAIEGNTIVVGARRQDLGSSNPNDNSGAAYIFTRSGTIWTQQTKLSAGGFYRAPGDEFGTSVGISGDTVIVSAPHETALNGTVNAGVTYVYRLDCVPPAGARALSGLTGGIDGIAANKTYCPGSNVTLSVSAFLGVASNNSFNFQWRKNGVNIPGATSPFYYLTNISATDAGSYDVFVSNSCGGEISSPAIISVHSFSITPSSQNFGAVGSNGIVNVSSTGTCGWTATSNSSFITITSGATGTAPGTVGFTVAANPGPNQRTGKISIAGQTFTVTQDGAIQNVVQFSASSYSVVEDCTTVSITVNRIGDTSGPASVDYHTSDVTATERKDYIKALGTLRFAPGETSKIFAVLINEDSFVEGNETFNLNLSNPAGVSLGGPAIATVTIIDDAAETTTNPIDDPQNYVCQHYHDFLNRQPDAQGLVFWTNQITACGTDAACIEARRINVSASFFLSIEFQDSGYLIERIYKAAFGDATGNSTFPAAHQLAVPAVRLNEFLADTQEIGQGVIVGQANWQQQIENNKQAFTAAFVLRPQFLTAFPLSMSAAQFVDTLNANAGNPLSPSERNQLVSDLSTNGKTRAQVLRAVAEDPDLNTAEYNRAFVLMQYFGYLRRNPNDSQDSDHTGYDFWLTKLNQFNGNYINAEMVKAFITSLEYRQRFGP